MEVSIPEKNLSHYLFVDELQISPLKNERKKNLMNHKHCPLWFAWDTEHGYELSPTSIDGHFTQTVVWDFWCTAFVTVESAIYSQRFENKRNKQTKKQKIIRQRKCDTKYSVFKRKLIHLRPDRWQAACYWAPGGSSPLHCKPCRKRPLRSLLQNWHTVGLV